MKTAKSLQTEYVADEASRRRMLEVFGTIGCIDANESDQFLKGEVREISSEDRNS